MENQQQPCKKRTRSHSASSSASQNNSDQPTKTIKTSQAQKAQCTEPEMIPSTSPQASQAPGQDEIAPPEVKPSDQNNSSKTSEEGSKLLREYTLDTDSPNPATALSTAETDPVSETTPVVYSNGDWEAVYDPQTNAYYFANSKTGETTWENPLIPSQPSTSRTAPKPLPDLGGIDPELAYLDPQMAKVIHAHSSQTEPRFTARFNAKTGRFEADPTRDPSRVSEYARARSQAEAFFDVAGWEKTLEKHNGRIPGTSKETRAAALEQGKKLSKAQLNQFKLQKMEKKARNQRAWLI